jgi:cytochrome P450 family 710 subfamily A protein
LKGPKWTVPFFGGLFEMVLHPYEFWHGQGRFGGVSFNALLGHLMVFSQNAQTTRKILENTSEDMPLYLHPNATYLLGKDNMAFLNGPTHKALRARLLPLFTQVLRSSVFPGL